LSGVVAQFYLPDVQHSCKLSVITLLHLQDVAELRPVLDQLPTCAVERVGGDTGCDSACRQAQKQWPSVRCYPVILFRRIRVAPVGGVDRCAGVL
jgi:hypothetical protein